MLKRLLLKNRLGLQQIEALQNRPSTSKCCVKSPSTSAEYVPCLHRFQSHIRQAVACSLVGHHAEVQDQCISSSHH